MLNSKKGGCFYFFNADSLKTARRGKGLEVAFVSPVLIAGLLRCWEGWPVDLRFGDQLHIPHLPFKTVEGGVGFSLMPGVKGQIHFCGSSILQVPPPPLTLILLPGTPCRHRFLRGLDRCWKSMEGLIQPGAKLTFLGKLWQVGEEKTCTPETWLQHPQEHPVP